MTTYVRLYVRIICRNCAQNMHAQLLAYIIFTYVLMNGQSWGVLCVCVCARARECVCVCVFSEKTCCMLTAIVSVKGADKAPLVAGERTQLRGKILENISRLDSYRMRELYNIGIV